MKFPESICVPAALALTAALAACGGGGSGTTTSTTPPPISVALAGAPASLLTKATAALTATVTNDSANAGVTWSVTCGSTGTGACGTFSNTTATTATYTAPAAIPTGTTVTVTATSVSDTTKSASVKITITTTIAVTLGPAPTSLQLSSGAAFTAFVADDSANAGVTWAVSCGSAACGSFTTAKTASGAPTDFSAPAAVPSGNTVTVSAISVTDATKSASAQITVTNANTTLANGTYIFSLAGADVASPYYAAGAFVVSGGSITTGEQDFIDLGTIANDKLNGANSAISITADGNLQITLTTCNGTDCSGTDTSVGVDGVETLDAALSSSSRARIIEFDGSATSSGGIALQTSATAPTAGYAFVISGFDGHAIPLAIGGVVNIDGSGTISGNGSVFDLNDSFFEGGQVLQKQLFAASTVSAPDSFGRVVFSLVPSAASEVSAIDLAGYIVDATHIRLIETTDSLSGTLAGVALGQGTNTGNFSSIAGNSYVAALTGFESIGAFQAAGVFSAGSGGTVSGAMNYNDLTGIAPQTPSAITGGTYTVDTTGRVTMTGVTDGIETFNLQFYLTGNAQENAATAITLDANDTLGGIGFQQTGGGFFSEASFFGAYTLDAAGVDLGANELNAVGLITADGAGSATGSVDLNDLAVGQNTSLPVSATFSSNTNGAFTGKIMGMDVTTNSNDDVFAYYVIDTTKVIAIETDQNQLTLALFTLEQ